MSARPELAIPAAAQLVDRKRAPGAGRKPRDPGGALATVGTTVRLTPADFSRVQAAAQAAGLTVAAYMASAIRSAARAALARPS